MIPDWPAYQRWRPEFGSVMNPDLYSLEWLDGQIWNGRAMLDHCEDAAIVSEWKHYPTGAFDIHGLVAAGDLDSIVNRLIPLALERARKTGAAGAIIESRDGWARVLRDQGFKPYQISVRKAL